MNNIWNFVSIVVIVFALWHCSVASGAPELNPDRYVSPSGSELYQPPAKLDVEPSYGEPLPAMPERFHGQIARMSLLDLIDAALEVSPSTRLAWMNAKAAAARWGESRSQYYPQISDNADAIGGKTPLQYGGRSFLSNSLSLNYLLLDFGGRNATVQQTKASLIESNMMYNQAVLDILRDVPKAYYYLAGIKALVDADTKSLKEAQMSLKAAEERRRAGVGTIADVLEASANEAQARYALESDRGQIEIARGRLATAVGCPANTPFDIKGELYNIPIRRMEKGADELVEMALNNRPDMKAAVAKLKQSEAELKGAKALHYPKLYATGNYDYFRTRIAGNSAYYGGVNLQIPIFQGFSVVNRVRAAKAKLAAANEALKLSKEDIITGAWDAHYTFHTSIKQLDAATALLDSAQKSFEVSFGRYKEGVADIVELMTVQSQLASARAQYINSRTNLHMNFAELIHAIGTGFQHPIESVFGTGENR